MAKPKRLIWGGMLVVSAAIVGLCLSYQPQRELSRTINPDGTAVVIVGHERVFGLFGIEIVFEHYDATGKLISASVKNQCWGWREARKKYAPAPP